jgi:MoaA/NifB/PqqE/SkfB family radical SAM enzyme
MGPTGDTVNVIQLHPTRRCNLRCQHCYSTSGPEQAGELPLGLMTDFLEDAVVEGYNAVGVSGGEPMTYGPLPQLLATARGLGYVTTVTTNGLLVDARRMARLAPHLSLLAISVDGVPASHDRLRARPHALDKMRERLAHVRDAGVPFGFIFTLTLGNLDELRWVTELALEEGAKLLQIHPLEQVGRARDYELLPPDDLELAYAFLEVARLSREVKDRLTLQLDVADRAKIEAQPCRAFAIDTPEASVEAVPLARLVSPLVLEDSGRVVPIQHGFAADLAIAELGPGRERFREQAARWKRHGYAPFLELSRQVWGQLRRAPPHLPFTNWYAAITNASRTGAGAGTVSLASRA